MVITGKIKTEGITEIKKTHAIAGKSQIIEYHHKPTQISALQKHNLAYRKKANPNVA